MVLLYLCLHHSSLHYCQHSSLLKDFNCTLRGLKTLKAICYPTFICLSTSFSYILMFVENRSLEERYDGWESTKGERVWEIRHGTELEGYVTVDCLSIEEMSRLGCTDIPWKEMYFQIAAWTWLDILLF